MKKIGFLLFTYIILFILPVPVFAVEDKQEPEIKVYVNDTKLQFDVPPIFINGRTMVPIRMVFESLGADVEWNNDTKTASISKGGKNVLVQLDNRIAQVDGKAVQMDVPATGIDGRILVPVRFISENLDLKVDWVNSTKTVFINELAEGNITGNQSRGRFASDNVWNYYILQNNTLIREHIATKNQSKVADHILSDLHFYKEWIYCVGIDQGVHKVIRLRKSGIGKEVIVDTPVDSFQIANDWIYYSDSRDQTVLYRTKTDGSETMEVIHDGNFSPKSWFVRDGWVFYQNLRTNTISRTRIDGSDSFSLTSLFAGSEIITSKSKDDAKVTFDLKLMDDRFLYLILDTGHNQSSGIYRLLLTGGRPQLIINKLPLSINMDKEWLYMAVEEQGNSKLIKLKKDGTAQLTINEYKENDIPQDIYVHNSSLYYTLLRGSNKLEFFNMNPDGENIEKIVWEYNTYYSRVKKVLSETASAHSSLNSISTFQVSQLKTKEQSQTIASEHKINQTDSLYYQVIEENDTDLEIWMDYKYIYSRRYDEKTWGIREHDSGKNFMQKTVFASIVPSEELCNNLTISEQNDKIILRGSGAFQDLMYAIAGGEELIFNNPSDFFETVTLEIVIDKESYLIDALTLEMIYYHGTDQQGVQSQTCRYSFTNSQFNRTLLYRPPSLDESLNLKKQTDYKIELAQNLIKKSEYQEAIQLLDDAISLYSKAQNAYLYKGHVLYNLGNYKEAILAYEQYREFAPYNINVHSHEGWCYLKLGNIAKAEQMAKIVLNLDQNNTQGLNLMGSIAAINEDYNDASEFLQTAFSLDSNYYEPHLNYASVLFSSGNFTRCIQTVDEFLHRFPYDRELMYLKAQSLSRQGKSAEAIRVYNQILDLNPSNDFVTMTYIAIEYESLQNYTRAKEYANKAQAIYPEYSLLKNLLEKLIYDQSTTSSQKLVDFIRKYYLFYREDETVIKAFEEITAKLNSYTIQDVEKLLETIKNPQDNSSYVLSGKDYSNYMTGFNKSFMKTEIKGDIVYCGMQTFPQVIGIQFTEFIQDIEKTEEKTLILDLRDNSGGLSNEANIILDALLPECTPSYIIERNGYISTFRSGKNYTQFKKIGILVNENTASSSELLALGLKTYLDNVTIIGKHTVGQGVGQTVYLDRMKQYAIFLVNHYWNVLQDNIHDEGLPIDIIVGDEDPDYAKALDKFLKE
ncbi:MAG: DUF5050 domain-containing protein [Clostridiaceae bacterium]|jgi:tetratricopeptide (TPR) repeat protein|nr:DUF5050 domain-containing protein [Clostridiaceae bacterium]